MTRSRTLAQTQARAKDPPGDIILLEEVSPEDVLPTTQLLGTYPTSSASILTHIPPRTRAVVGKRPLSPVRSIKYDDVTEAEALAHHMAAYQRAITATTIPPDSLTRMVIQVLGVNENGQVSRRKRAGEDQDHAWVIPTDSPTPAPPSRKRARPTPKDAIITIPSSPMRIPPSDASSIVHTTETIDLGNPFIGVPVISLIPGEGVPLVEMGECMICYESSPLPLPILLEGITNVCSHHVCRDCLRPYVLVEIEKKRLPIACPDTECKEFFLEDRIFSVLDPEEKTQWMLMMEEKSMWGKIHCPNPRCSILFDACQVPTSQRAEPNPCPYCATVMCILCGKIFHHGKTCAEHARDAAVTDGAEDQAFIKMANRRKWARCGECGVVVEKNRGCNHISCICGHHFCYKCGDIFLNYNHKCAAGAKKRL